MKKTLVLIVHGSKEKSLPLLQPLIRKFYQHFGVYEDVPPFGRELKEYLNKKDSYDVQIFEWSGGITKRFSLLPTAKKLAERITAQKQYKKIVLIAKSLGGVIAELALQEISNPHNVSKLIFIATPHKLSCPQIPENIQVYNVFSSADNYIDFAHKVLYFGKGVKILQNACNVHIPNLRHDDFNLNISVEFQGRKKKLFEVYRKLIEG